jgi:formylglycine-generating enzyme required for sulfatase activity
MWRLAILVFIGLCVWGSASLNAQEPPRIALLIGNQGYADKVGPLKNPHNDVAHVEAALKGLNFKVTVVKDASKSKMDEAVRRYVDDVRRAGPGAVSFFYYSGHGAVNPESKINFLIPVDVTSRDTTEIWYQSIEQSDVIDKLSKYAPAASHFVVFDACRNELNVTDVTGVLERGFGDEKGFMPVKDVRGMLIVYATGEKKTASDSGVFAKVLAEELPKKGVEALMMFRQVQLRVQQSLKQEPWMSLGYLPQVYLAGALLVEKPGDGGSSAETPDEVVALREQVARLEAAQKEKRDKPSAEAAALQEKISKMEQQIAALSPPLVKPPVENSAKPAVGIFQKPAVGDTLQDCANCPEMVVVPAGRFMMGSPSDEPERSNDEGPQHHVTIAKPFAVGKYAVTFAEWDVCVADGGCGGYKPEDQGWGRADRPVINVNWDDAKAYVKWLSGKTGKTYRLLSEAEREYVARAGTTTPFWWGSSITPIQANYDGSVNPYKGGGKKGEYRQRTVPVKSFTPNRWGLYQVHGNVWEWTEDCWNANYDDAPTDGSANTAGDCNNRVVRGGSWIDSPRTLRAAFRLGNATDFRNNNLGFRVARTLNPVS